MISTVFGVSFALLTAIVAMKRYESRHGTLFCAGARDTLDRGILASFDWVQRSIRACITYAKRDIGMRGLQMVTYVALVVVQGIEHRLAAAMRFFRALRRQERRTSVALRETLAEDERVHARGSGTTPE